MKASEKNRIIKKALVEEYKGQAKIRVVGGRGTAYGWVEIYLELVADHMKFDVNDYGSKEMNIHRRAHAQRVRDRARKALEEVGEKFYTYLSDDGYDSENECLLVNVSYK